MPSLFSHAHEPDYVAPRTSEATESSVVLDVPIDQAFDGFTDAVHLWWPVAEQSVFGDGSHAALLRDHLVEEAEDGEEMVWADVLEWESPEFIKLHWTLGQDLHGGSDVEIHFEPVENGMTRVRVGFLRVDASDDASDESFVCDWPLILSRYARFMGGASKLD
ncbi:SRPBCC domain-containing protein [Arthrobacter sp. LAPM80]|uniref:SRPBCC domain-containing protein n=1 Tax=Arthrobacter sp. LAPM80 TaxID=3141788 RepID=UPI00398B156A